ncbi:DUF6361 family protein [Aminobacter anthyllidis]|uniref:DUF6361 family protein n=1 Tax=Aminobacter anthyllidis TaxID=1035067 RepID=UPI002455C953|nr:DUF6361 family protein [Aminobacter anthyllidis]MDH4986920.1 DUF6361 family protein [Aminobacter anthyllidis]
MMFGGNAGVRDEVGFLIVHQRYSDHLFPGTSVLHTRLRYTLFIPWLYQSLRAKRPVPKDFAQAFIALEHGLTGRLQFKDGEGEPDGVIGGEVYPRAISQPPAYVYWTALAKWGLIGTRPDGRPLSRSDMARLLAAGSKRSIHDDDGKPLETVAWPITSMIDAPAGWDGDGKLTLELSAREREFLARKLRAVRSPSDPSEPSLLSKLVGRSLGDAVHCWGDDILGLAGKDAARLKRAGQAAALSAIGRAVYAALVESLKELRDKRPQGNPHRKDLGDVVEEWGSQASALDFAQFLDDVGYLPAPVEAVLRETLVWVRSRTKDPAPLLDVYERAEYSRKGDRARLANNQFGVDRRMEWQGEKHGFAEPLHYRWDNVKRLLWDLEGSHEGPPACMAGTALS